MPFERLEPYAVKVASTVLRRGRSREASSLSDKKELKLYSNTRTPTFDTRSYKESNVGGEN